MANNSFKAPPFMMDSPRIWFIHLEALFAGSNITDQTTKFNKVVEVLDREVFKHLSPDDLEPADENPYDVLKEELLLTFKKPESSCVEELINLAACPFNDSPIGEIASRVDTLLGGIKNLGDCIRRMAISKGLPKKDRTVLTSTVGLDKKSYLNLAKEIRNRSSIPDDVHQVNPKRNKTTKKKECWYHQKFGNKAKKCETPDLCPPLEKSGN